MSQGLGTQQSYSFPNKISRILLLSMAEVMGQNGLNAVLNTATLQKFVSHLPSTNFDAGLTFEETARLFEAVEGIYGIRGGQRLAHQTGQMAFKYGVQDFRGVLGIADFVFRVLPLAFRMRIALEVQAEIFNRYSDQHILLGENQESFFWVMDRCGICWGRRSQQPTCSFLVGLLDESLYWVSNGRRFKVEEVACVAVGAEACVIAVQKVSLLYR